MSAQAVQDGQAAGIRPIVSANADETTVMRFGRFSVRWLLIAVAILAVGLSCWKMVDRSRTYRLRARSFAKRERNYRDFEQMWRRLALKSEERTKKFETETADSRRGLRADTARRLDEFRKNSLRLMQKHVAADKAEADQDAAIADYFGSLREKYTYAASHPWRIVPPDPPPPEPKLRGDFWAERGEYKRALAAYDEAIRQQPENPVLYNGKAWLLATCPDARVRNGRESIRLASRACELAGEDDASYLDTVAAAYAESGDFPRAIEYQQRAMRVLSRAARRTAEFQVRLDLYRAGKPYREPARSQ